MGELIMNFIFMIPLYAVLVWTYFYPEESMLFGQRWMYKEEPEFSDEAIRSTKLWAMAGIVLITMGFVLYAVDDFLIRLIILLLFITSAIIAGYRLLKKYVES